MTPKEQVLHVHPKADVIRDGRSYVVSAVYTANHGKHGCWPIGVGETEELAWRHASEHYTVNALTSTKSVKT